MGNIFSFYKRYLLIVSLQKHGKEVFGIADIFNTWLQTNNFHFDNKKPLEFLNTISGIKLVNDCLTGMQYGDNV